VQCGNGCVPDGSIFRASRKQTVSPLRHYGRRRWETCLLSAAAAADLPRRQPPPPADRNLTNRTVLRPTRDDAAVAWVCRAHGCARRMLANRGRRRTSRCWAKAPRRGGRELAFSVTSSKSRSGHMSDRGHMRGRVPRPASHTRGRLGKRRDGHGNLLHVLAADCGRSCVVFCPAA
jgi:hypothetical protein